MEGTLELTSSAFKHRGVIPAKYTCDDKRELSPPLTISGVPEGTKSLVLIMDDPDIPQVVKEARGIDVFDHWVLYNIPAPPAGGKKEILEGTSIGTAGLNSVGMLGYVGPCPPPQFEPREHRYVFTLYALDSLLSLGTGATKGAVLGALAPMLIEKAELIGRYARE